MTASAKIIAFPRGEAHELLEQFVKMMDAGTIKEIFLFAPDATDGGATHYVEVSGGITLMNVLMAKQILSSIADKCEDIV